MRVLCAGLLTLACGLFAACSNGQKEPAEARLKAIRTKFDADFAELVKKFENAKTPAEQAGVRAEAKELMALTAEKAVAVAAENPKDPVAFDAAEFVVGRLGAFGGSGETEKAVGIIAEHHIANPKVKDLMVRVNPTGPAGQKLLKAAAEKAGDKDVKGLALYLLGSGLAAQVEDAPEDKAAGMAAEATKYLEEAAKVAPETKVPGGTIGDKVKADLEALKETVASLKDVVSVGKAVPDVEGTNLDGKRVKLSSFKGKVVLLDIWATWCPPCRAMIPHERDMVKKLADKPFVLLSVSADNKKEALTEFLAKEPMPWSHWWDGDDRKVLKAFKVKAFPTLYLIGADGVVLQKWVGSPGNDVLDKAVEDAVKAAEKK